MKRFNNYLLTHHPLVWNLRLHWVWPAILLLHLLFFISGYYCVSPREPLATQGLYPGGITVSMAFLTGALTGILWLIFYFRNNAFKQYYPVRRARLMAEALLVFPTVFGLSTFTASFQGGIYQHIRSMTAGTDLRKEGDIVNLAHHFIAFDRDDFRSSGDCIYQHFSGNDRTTAHAATSTDTFSYLHYCSQAVALSDDIGLRSVRASDSIAKRWLFTGRKDSVEILFRQLLAICKKYGAGYRFDPVKMAAAPFARAGFLIAEEVSRDPWTHSEYEEDGLVRRRVPAEVFIEAGQLPEALSTVSEVRNGWMDGITFLLLFYCTLGIGLLIFSFRITELRAWVIALIGAGIWMILVGGIGAAANGRYGLTFVFLVLTLVFLGAAIYLIRRKELKRIAGVMLIWTIWTLPAFLPLLMDWIQHQVEPVFNPRYASDSQPPSSPLYTWINSHLLLINGINALLVTGLLWVLIIPLARAWQAMPEE